MQPSAPVVKDLVLIGGGHSHIAVLRSFGMQPIPGVRLTLISPDTLTPYSGMLPGLIAGHYTVDEAHIDLTPLTRFADARFIKGIVTGIEPSLKMVSVKDRPPIPYDLLSINSGSIPSTEGVEGASEFVVPVKPISQFLSHWRALRERLEDRDGPTNIGIVGAGAGGVELTLAVQHVLAKVLPATEYGRLRFELVTADGEILATHPPAVARRFRRILASRGIDVHTHARIVAVDGGRLRDSTGRVFAFDEVLWVTNAQAPRWLGASGLATNEQGFLLLDDRLRSISHPDIFGAGDVATMRKHPRPKAGVFAVRQGPPLVKNLRRSLLGKSPTGFRPQKRFLTLISTGDQYAVASRGAWSTEGAWVWRWKNWIDRRFMERYQDLPEMVKQPARPLPRALADPEASELTGETMRCGGCGAKIGADVLAAALEGLAPAARDDVVVGLNEPDDAALISVPADKLSVLSVDAFRPMVGDPYVFGQITANHCLGDIYAMGAEPQSALAIAALPVWPREKLVDELRQMLLGALEVFERSGTALVGGHTSESAEVSLGFTITGLIDRQDVLQKATLRPGDSLLLTKALGTGAIMAADMRAKARGRWVDAALDSMLLSNRLAGRLLRAHGATGCTDITGFGLAGHISEMLAGGALGATLDLSALPVLDGSLEAFGAGIASSLQPTNEGFARRIADAEAARDNPRFQLLFDPQTAGGLLAGVPEAQVESCLAELRGNGYATSAVIGSVGERKENMPIRIETR